MKAINVSGCSGQGKGDGKGAVAIFDESKTQARVKSFNDTKGWGFIDHEGTDIFVHVKDCLDGRPQVGDLLTFEIEDDPVRGEGQLKASNVTGCSGVKGKGKSAAVVPMASYGAVKGGCMPMANGYGPYGAAPMMAYATPYGCYGQMGCMGMGMPQMAFYPQQAMPQMAFGMHPGKGNSAGNSSPKGMKNGGAKGTGKFQGAVKSFNDTKGWGFIDYNGSDIFIHVNQCDGRPVTGDWVSYDMEDDPIRGAGQKKAVNVVGCTGVKGQTKGTAFGMGKGFFLAITSWLTPLWNANLRGNYLAIV
jgi:cold shock CspA family protein